MFTYYTFILHMYREAGEEKKKELVEEEERPPNSEDLLLFSPKEMDILEDTDEKWVGRYTWIYVNMCIHICIFMYIRMICTYFLLKRWIFFGRYWWEMGGKV
jgi:hypothetical protein